MALLPEAAPEVDVVANARGVEWSKIAGLEIFDQNQKYWESPQVGSTAIQFTNLLGHALLLSPAISFILTVVTILRKVPSPSS